MDNINDDAGLFVDIVNKVRDFEDTPPIKRVLLDMGDLFIDYNLCHN